MMAADTKIQWCDHTLNPWRGCTKVAPECEHCYADTMSKRNPKTLGVWGPRGTRVVAAESYWRQPLKWNRQAEAAGERRRVFCASLADVFEEWDGPMLSADGRGLWRPHDQYWNRGGGVAPADWWVKDNEVNKGDGLINPHVVNVTMADVRRRLFMLIDQTPHLDWLLLTKRPENVLRMWPAGTLQPAVRRMAYWNATGGDAPLTDDPAPRRHNVWLGTSAGTQATADKAIPELLKCRDLSPVLFVSAEPLLESVDLGLQNASCDCCPRWASRWVRMTRPVGPDLPFLLAADADSYVADAGVYRAESNRHGALSVHTPGGLLGIKPDEFDVLPGLDWIIAGGESGHGARPCDVAWLRSIRDQCKAAGVACFVKQLGAVPYMDSNQLDKWALMHDRDQLGPGLGYRIKLTDKKGGEPSEWPEDLRIREVPHV